MSPISSCCPGVKQFPWPKSLAKVLAELEAIHHERHFDRAGGTGSPVNLSEIKRGKLRVGHDNSPRPKGAGIFTTSNGGDENGHKFATMRLPEVHNVEVNLGVEGD